LATSSQLSAVSNNFCGQLPHAQWLAHRQHMQNSYTCAAIFAAARTTGALITAAWGF